MTRTSSGKTMHRLHVCHCSHHFYSLYPSDLPCSAGPAAEGTCWKALHESERILKQQICIIIFKFGWNSKLLMLQNLFVVAPFKEHWAQCQSLLQANCQHVSEVFLFACFALWASGCRGNCFPIQKTNSLWSFCCLFSIWPSFFFVCLFCFLDLLHPLKTTTKRKMDPANDRQTNSYNTKK